MKTIADVNLKGKKVLVRVDFNVPLTPDKKITDETRIKETIPTIRKILDDGGAVILMSHLGRPKSGFDPEFSMAPVVPVLSRMLNKDIVFIPELFGSKVKEAAAALNPGDVMLLENLRFHKEEEKADKNFAKEVAALGDVYVNDAFATAHRAHMSTAIIAEFFPGNKYFGFLLANEKIYLDKVLHDARRPFTAIIGGAKVSTKIPVLKNLVGKVDNLIIGGGMMFTFMNALGGAVGKSLFEPDCLEQTKEILNEAMYRSVNLYLPIDAVISDAFANDANTKVCPSNSIPGEWKGLDIGPKSRAKFAEVIYNSQTILWNGPMGVFEMPAFSKGTKAIAIAVANATLKGSFSLLGGGDSVAAVNEYNLCDMFSYVSTGGGAMLEYMEGLELPGIKALME
ncbi:MAG: phosphoglycerate kinase [Bacteroidia bacterium]|nr:phosphoglycerate kinase [Bacteroidia bacterium]